MTETIVAVPAAQVLLSLIPMIGIIMAAILIFFYLLWRHRQIIRQIDVGTYVRHSFDTYAFALFAGILLTLTGLVLTVLFLYLNGISYILLGGLIPFIIGVSLLIVLVIMTKKESEFSEREHHHDLV